MVDRFVSNLVLYFLVLLQDFHPGRVVNAQRCEYNLKSVTWIPFIPQNCHWLEQKVEFKKAPVFLEHLCFTFHMDDAIGL